MSERTTAEMIGAFRKELGDAGIDTDLADQLTRDAAGEILQYGISLREEPTDG